MLNQSFAISHRKMWMVPRNFRRIEVWRLVQMISLIESCDGTITSQAHQNELYEQLSLLGVKRDRSEAGIDNQGGFRTYLAMLSCLGLYYKLNKKYHLTHAGQTLVNDDDPIQVLRCQLLRMQYPSTYGHSSQVKISPDLKVKPFVFLIKLLQDDRVNSLTSEEAAIAVVYGRTFDDYEKCVSLIKRMRETGGTLESLVENVADVCTPRRKDGPDLMQRGCKDAIDIANTFLNYLEGAALVIPVFGQTSHKVVELSMERDVLNAIEKWANEKIEPFNQVDSVAWQKRFGRFDREKDTRSSSPRRKRDGLASLISCDYINEVKNTPIIFDHNQFVIAATKKWRVPRSRVEQICSSFKGKVKNIERDCIEQAAISGGGDSVFFEHAVNNIFIKLGFDESENCSRRKAPHRAGGFPDVYIKAGCMKTCGFADAKATAKYEFEIGDREKLKSYYHDCDKDINPNVRSTFFIYVAGGFTRSEKSIVKSLIECRENYDRPVSAITVRALLDLLESEQKLSPEQLIKVFEKGRFFYSSSEILDCVS